MGMDYRARLAAHNDTLNAYVDMTDEPIGAGLCWAVKSNIAVKGLPWTAGCDAYGARLAQTDAAVIERIRAAGHTILGTVNMHEGALGATTDNAAYGRTHNPWKHGFTPGGSSGGSGAAVAAGLCDVALGTDTMGSVRIPAAYCGVQGHKPTTGIVPDEGVVPLSTSLDHVGPLARDVDMLWQAMHVIANWGEVMPLNPAGLSGLRIGIWDGAGAVELAPAIAANFIQVLSQLRTAGAELVPFTPPGYAYSHSRRAGLLISEVEGAKEHGVSVDGPRPDGLSDNFYGLLHWGTQQSAAKLDAAYQHIREVHLAAETIWDEIDVVLAPTAPQKAFDFADNVPANQADFTAWADFARLPATALYTGLSEERLPLSVQIIGPEGDDQKTLQIAATLEQLFGRPPMPDGYAW